MAGAVADEPCHVHLPTHVQFGSPPTGFTCSGGRVLDAEREEITVAYKSTIPGRTLTVTVYVYQKLPPCSSPDESLADHLAVVRAEVARRYTGFECESWLPKGHPAMSGLRCTGSSAEIGPGRYITYIGLEELKGWWLKIRATSKANEEAEAGETGLESVLMTIGPCHSTSAVK
jgi:hypothetical protein